LNFDPNQINIKIVKNNENNTTGHTPSLQIKKKKGASVINSRVAIDQMQNDNVK